jgi:hypothetical protein
MQRTACRLELFPAPGEIDRVVAVPSIRCAAMRAHQPTGAQLTQVVRHEALPLGDELRQLTDRPVASHELPQQQPPQRMRQQPHDSRWTTSGAVCRSNRLHALYRNRWWSSHQTRLMYTGTPPPRRGVRAATILRSGGWRR